MANGKTFNDDEPSVQKKIQANIYGGDTDTGYVIFENFQTIISSRMILTLQT